MMDNFWLEYTSSLYEYAEKFADFLGFLTWAAPAAFIIVLVVTFGASLFAKLLEELGKNDG